MTRIPFLGIIFFLFSIFYFLNFSSLLAEERTIVINEIAWMGTKESSYHEWIELYNLQDYDIDLSDWVIKAEDGSPYIKIEKKEGRNTIIPKKGYFLLERSDDKTLPQLLADQIFTGSLENNGEKLKIIDKEGKEIELIDCSFGWYAGNNLTKQTMERINPQISSNLNLKENWKDSRDPGGTPKALNSQFSLETTKEETKTEESVELIAEAGNDIISLLGKEIIFDASESKGNIKEYFWNFGDGNTAKGKTVSYKYNLSGKYLVSLIISDGEKEDTDLIQVIIYPRSIFISEFLPDPRGKDNHKEWIEIINESDNIEDISGWIIKTKQDETGFILPKGTYISAKDFLLIYPKDKITLLNKEGSIFLVYPSGEIVQEIKYKETKEGWSIVRKGKEYFATFVPTPGEENIISDRKEVSFRGEKEQISSYSFYPEESNKTKEIKEKSAEVRNLNRIRKTNPLEKLPYESLTAQIERYKKNLIFSVILLIIFSGVSGFAFLKLKEKIKNKEKKSKEIIEVEIEKEEE